ncbi:MULTISPECIES: PhzF family phenazine biosynthesis protein [Diaphorobacter]|uniref:Phenazine biosynthesis protein PhzF family n=1 Tax=Acidovorax ebreus (strain TPSY) TaxID=535289 RepID=A0A9J9QCG5_ACIET|nr:MULTISPECIES: PhzF family phenazine biosynthesis protein [Diaphorobacter]UOB06163.1 PhzF family phenazine biosynthesis protein [Diaphorobacter sp. LI3]ACM34552.1 phenazine biosynthesis protein PhzF family [[Acidovorax] ebreus TPSY]ASI70048.1 phenazine biosynthesis protein PhzF [Diaphorobacter nitroreducens]KLR59631.1 phenazine biosynthesis protein PhzF [Diaphorobacter sp. J5-51]POR10418.1 phenazine biosynthesis protein PhzF [Diaphorobacter sp. LR2014-1]
MRLRPFQQVDVFTATPYLGNPLAVVLDGEGLSTEEMQRFTNWTNLSEATFVLPPTPEGHAAGADYRVRIFCPGRELPFAGHPTLGTCHAWLQAGGQPRATGRIVQECGVGLVTLRRDGEQLAFAAPPLVKSGPLAEDDVQLIARGLGVARDDIVAHAWCDNGPNWRGVMLRSAEQVLGLRPDGAVLAGLDVGVVGPRGKVGVVGASDAEGIAFEVRAFFPGNNGLAEDPVTGSLNAALAQWLIGAGLAPSRYVASQGTALGRAGRVHVQQDGPQIWVGGHSVTCVRGEVRL